ncbi:hypothetical protein EHW67_17730 [Arenibacter aquaticus]|uniref:Uncharacterized protein n=1 Tax=Arenibacter aquaticus TaxID=2489054 RepID=A0A430JYS7_9FLAO|nr:hypothetical protein [Arenibacter aquaticus]RTE52039.1 hypothetical protein EHW67_17730 [Arenibacter aquaticus]
MKHELTDLIHLLSHWVHQEQIQHSHSHYNNNKSHGALWQHAEDQASSHGPHLSVAPHQHPHKNGPGQDMEPEHDHKVIAFLNQMFQDTDPEQEPYKKVTVEMDVDKHLAEEPGDLPTPIYCIKNNNFPSRNRDSFKSDFPPLTPPPDHFYRS